MPAEFSYQEFEPDPELRQDVHRYWALRTRAPGPQQPWLRSLPLGLPELIITVDGWVAEVTPGPRLPRAVIAGQMTASRRFRASDVLWVFGVAFTPTGCTALLDAPAHDLVDAVVAPAAASTFAQVLAERLAEAPDDLARAVVADAALRARSRARTPRSPQELTTVRATRLVADRRGNVTIEQLAREVGASLSALERAFVRQLGIGPKEYTQLVRFRRMLHRLDGARGVQDLMADDDFADQAHLTREFRRRVGMPPGRYLRAEKSPMEQAILRKHRGPPQMQVTGPGAGAK